jgi:hypothetical protein
MVLTPAKKDTALDEQTVSFLFSTVVNVGLVFSEVTVF